MTTPLNLIGEQTVAQRVRAYTDMVQRSLETISDEKREQDGDVKMLLSHVAAMIRGLHRLCDEVEDRDARIAGLRAQLKDAKV